MSTSYSYRCASHDPPLRADDDGWPPRGILEQDLARRADIVALPDLVWDELSPDRHWWWLRKHPHCVVELVSEYGELIATETPEVPDD